MTGNTNPFEKHFKGKDDDSLHHSTLELRRNVQLRRHLIGISQNMVK